MSYTLGRRLRGDGRRAAADSLDTPLGVATLEAARHERYSEAAYVDIVTDDLPEWNQDPGLLNWLANL